MRCIREWGLVIVAGVLTAAAVAYSAGPPLQCVERCLSGDPVRDVQVRP